MGSQYVDDIRHLISGDYETNWPKCGMVEREERPFTQGLRLDVPVCMEHWLDPRPFKRRDRSTDNHLLPNAP
jgi:hypothetical protein